MRIRGTTFRFVVSLALVVAFAAPAVITPVGSVVAADPPRTLAFGAFPQTRGGQTQRQATEQLETQIGRRLEVVRVFERWTDQFPDAFHQWLRDTDRTAILSVKPVRANGTRITWSALASAAPGSQIDTEMRSWARRLRDFGKPIYVTLHHEPEAAANISYGTDVDYISAWRRWVDVLRQEGATNARFMFITTDYSYSLPASDRRYTPKWYPGDDWVDSLAIDAYNWHVCRPNQDNAWKPLAQIIEPFRQFGALHPTKDLWLTEWASWDDPAAPGHKAQWIDEANVLFAQPAYAQFVGVSYFNSGAINADFVNCQWWVDTSASSLASFANMANAALWQGDAFGEPPPPPGDGPVFRVGRAASSSGTAASIVVPSAVAAGDRLLLVVTANVATTATTPAGWTLLATQSDGTPDLRSWVFTRVGAAGIAGTTVTSQLGASAKSSRVLLAYSAAGTPIATSAVAGPSTAGHATPPTTLVAGATVVSYWADKTAANSGWTLPAGVQLRASSVGSGSGRITAAIGDTAQASSNWAGATATSTASSAKSIMWTIAVPPA
jgi:hypothetical protein